MGETIRIPRQVRSIETKNKIIEAGYTLFAEKGYHNTNTAEIAKEAGVSTGIVYGYFRDKRDILVDVLDIYTERVLQPVFALFDGLTPPLDFDYLLSRSVDLVVEMHTKNASMHEALHALTHTDEAVRLKFLAIEDNLTKKISERLSAFGYVSEGLIEKVHLAIQTVQAYAHEYVFDKHDYIDYTLLYRNVVGTLDYLFS